MKRDDNNGECHPLEPFLPENARLLMLGSFPPQRHRWSMEFFYPNLQNDMWRIVGYLATGDKTHFLAPDAKRFDRERIETFCREKGLALYDTAVEVIRLKDNASDNFLQVVQEVDLAALLARIPACRDIVTTGQKATDTLRSITGCDEPSVGGCVEFRFAGRELRLWRMPSSSRAYPRPVEWKAEFYRKVFVHCGII
ncbi:MAG: uracil-DNA glycosylase family protein [Alistipes sp.]|nr:uracil-DNA glycosylase family protein [Alistipes sp.]